MGHKSGEASRIIPDCHGACAIEFYNFELLSTLATPVKFIIDNWLLILIAFVSGGLLVWPAVARNDGTGSVSTAEAVRLINREKAVLIDVSEPAEYAASHVAGARNVPLGTLETSKNLPANKTLPDRAGVPAPAHVRRVPRVSCARWVTRMRTCSAAAWRLGVKPICRWRSRPDRRCRGDIVARHRSAVSGTSFCKTIAHATRQDVHDASLPVLHRAKMLLKQRGVVTDRRDPRRSKSRAARIDDGSAQAGAPCRRSSSARPTSAGATT